MVMTRPRKLVEEAEKVIEKDQGWFMKEYQDAKHMPKEAERIAKDLHRHALNKKDIANFRLLVFQLSQLENDERWQVFRVGYNKLRDEISELLKLNIFNLESRKKQRNRLIELTNENYALKGLVFSDSTKKLEPMVNNKELHQISEKDWNRIQEITGGLLTKLRALVRNTREMEKVIEKATGIKI